MFGRRSRRSSTGRPRLRGPSASPLPLIGCLVLLGTTPAAAEAPRRVTVLAQTDSRAELIPCHCEGLRGGSLGLRAALFKQVQPSRGAVVILDGGDFVPAPDETSRAALIDLMLDAMELMPYDAVGLGGLEVALGPGFLAGAAVRLPLVCANLHWPGGEGVIPRVRWVEADGLRIAVTGYVDPMLYFELPGVLENLDDDFILLDPVESLDPLLAGLRDEADLVVVLAHAEIPRIQELLEGRPGIDVLVLGHEPEEAIPALRIGTTEVMVPGPRSREVVQLTLGLDPAGTVVDRHARVWHLKRLTRTDRRVEELVRRFEAGDR